MSSFPENATVNNPPPSSGKWKWIALILLLPAGALLCCCGGGITVFMGAMSQVKSSETYTEALRRAKADPDVQELLGEPITDGYLLQSNYRTTNGIGEMTIESPLSGSKGTATLKVRAGNQERAWKYFELEVRSPGGKVIDLRTDAEKGIGPGEN